MNKVNQDIFGRVGLLFLMAIVVLALSLIGCEREVYRFHVKVENNRKHAISSVRVAFTRGLTVEVPHVIQPFGVSDGGVYTTGSGKEVPTDLFAQVSGQNQGLHVPLKTPEGFESHFWQDLVVVLNQDGTATTYTRPSNYASNPKKN